MPQHAGAAWAAPALAVDVRRETQVLTEAHPGTTRALDVPFRAQPPGAPTRRENRDERVSLSRVAEAPMPERNGYDQSVEHRRNPYGHLQACPTHPTR